MFDYQWKGAKKGVDLLGETSLFFLSSGLRRTSYKTEWHHNHSRLAQGVPSQQTLRVASGGTNTVQNFYEV